MYTRVLTSHCRRVIIFAHRVKSTREATEPSALKNMKKLQFPRKKKIIKLWNSLSSRPQSFSTGIIRINRKTYKRRFRNGGGGPSRFTGNKIVKKKNGLPSFYYVRLGYAKNVVIIMYLTQYRF